MDDRFDWLTMSQFMQKIHYFSRNMLAPKKMATLTGSEIEILSLLYMEQALTPITLSRKTGRKLESVSRTLKALSRKHLITKQKCPEDERSYRIWLTDEGDAELNKNYTYILGPLYHLARQMGPDFDRMIQLISQADTFIENAANPNTASQNKNKEES